MADSMTRTTERYHQVRAWAGRIQPTALAIRVAVYVTGLAALLAVAPPQVSGLKVIAFGAFIALLPALRPTKAWSTVLIILSIALWVMTGEGRGYALAFLAGALLYLHHTTTAQAVTVRTDTFLPHEVLFGWARRTGLVLLASGVISLGLSFLPGLFGRTSAFAVGLAGFAAVLGLGLVLVWLVHRKH